MGGGGGTDYSAEAAREEAKKQAARDAVNAAFGIAPTGAAPTTTSAPGALGAIARGVVTPRNGLEDGYDPATTAYNSNVSDATTNATARDALYDKVRSDAYTAGKTGLDETKTSAARNNKFALFAQGLNGGSQDVDESALLDRTYSKGLLDLGAKADAAKTDLKTSDENARLGLLQGISNGMDQGSALSSALTQMKNGVDSAEASAQGTDLGDLFAGSGLLYTKSLAARGQQAANAYFGSQYPQYAQLSGGNANGGIVTKF